MGGPPDLPAGFEWPIFRGKPMTCLAQIRLADLDPFRAAVPVSVPRSGWLCFFHQASNQLIETGPWPDGEPFAARYVPPASNLQLSVSPTGCEWFNFSLCSLSFSIGLTLPNVDSSLLPLYEKELGTNEQQIAYWKLREEVLGREFFTGGYHQLFGYEAAVGEGIVSPEQTLLMQIDSDGNPGWGWVDEGKIYYVIDNADLATGNFAAAKAVVQYH